MNSLIPDEDLLRKVGFRDSETGNVGQRQRSHEVHTLEMLDSDFGSIVEPHYKDQGGGGGGVNSAGDNFGTPPILMHSHQTRETSPHPTPGSLRTIRCVKLWSGKGSRGEGFRGWVSCICLTGSPPRGGTRRDSTTHQLQRPGSEKDTKIAQKNSIAFGKSTLQRIYLKHQTPPQKKHIKTA